MKIITYVIFLISLVISGQVSLYICLQNTFAFDISQLCPTLDKCGIAETLELMELETVCICWGAQDGVYWL